MGKEPIIPPRPQPAEPQEPPVKDPQPYEDPVELPPGDPNEDRPMRDPARQIKIARDHASSQDQRSRLSGPKSSLTE